MYITIKNISSSEKKKLYILLFSVAILNFFTFSSYNYIDFINKDESAINFNDMQLQVNSLDNGLTNITFETNETINQVEWNKIDNDYTTIDFNANNTSGNQLDDQETVLKTLDGSNNYFSPVFQSRSYTYQSTEVSSLTLSHTVPNGDDRLLVVIVGLEGDNSVSTCTYGGASLTHLIQARSGSTLGCCVELWYMINPPTGTDDVHTSFSDSNPSYLAAMSYEGVDQNISFGAYTGATGNDINPHVDIKTKISHSLIIGGIETYGGDTYPFNPYTDINERYDFQTGTSIFYDAGCWGGDMNATTPQQYTFGAQASKSDNWAIVCAELRVSDDTPPGYFNFTKSADPLVQGSTEIITLNVIDFSGVNQVLIEIEGINNTMTNIGGDLWRYDSWTPKTLGINDYIIWMEDIMGNWGFISDSIEVIEITPPITNLSFRSDYTIDYVNGSTIFTLSADDGIGSGINRTSYKIDDGTWMDYSTSFDLGSYSDGMHCIYYYSIDNLGNVEMQHNKTIYLYDEKDAPTTSIDYILSQNPNYVNTSTRFTLNADDGTGSGINTTMYRIDSGIWMTYGGPFTLYGNPEGIHIIYFYSIDNVGNNETSVNSVIIELQSTPDEDPPFTMIHFTVSHEPNYVIKTTIISFIADDGNGTGVADTYYRIGSGNWNVYSDPFDLSGYSEGNHTIYFYSTDIVGNIESTNSTSLYLDINGPLTNIIYSGVAPNYIANTTKISFFSSDGTGSGTSIISYKIDENIWNVYTEPFDLSGYSEGFHTIYFNSKDNVGNIESTNSTAVYLDLNPPSTSIDYNIAHGLNYINETTIFSLIFNDGIGSGTAITSYRIDSGAWSTYSSSFTLNGYSEGFHTIYYNSIDLLGNIEFTHSETIYLDVIKSTASLLFSSLFTTDYVNSTTLFKLSANDGKGSGINMIAYQIDGGSWTEYSGPFTLSGEGVHWICYNSTDNVGNVEVCNNKTIYLYDEKESPNTMIEFKLFRPPNYVNSSTLFMLSANDNAGSGVACIYYKIDDGSWKEYSSTFSLSGHGLGVHIIYYYSIDNVGNNGAVKSINVNHINSLDTGGNDPGLIKMMMVLIVALVIISAGFTSIMIKVKSSKSNKYKVSGEVIKAKRILDKLDQYTTISFVNSCLNDILTKYGNDMGIWYYKEPRIYHDKQKKSDGLILNVQNFLYTQLMGTEDKSIVRSEIGIDPNNTDHIKAIQVFFISDLSQEKILDICLNYQTPDLMNIIIGIKWPKFEYARTLDIPYHDDLYYRDNFRVINSELFLDLIGLDGKYRTIFNKIIEYEINSNIEGLKKIKNSINIIPHNTEDLREYLKEKGFINNNFDEYFEV